VVLDMFKRQMVGWRLQPHVQGSLVTDALRMAWFLRAPDEGVGPHAERGKSILRPQIPVSIGGRQHEKLDDSQG